MKNKSLLILIALTLSFVTFIAGYIIGITTDRTIIMSDSNTNATHAESTTSVYVDGMININIASVSDLTQLPGIGETLANNIITYRKDNGPFGSVEELLNVEGIGTKRLTALKDYITVSGG